MNQNRMNEVKMEFVNEIASAVTKYTESVMDLVRTMTVADLASEHSPLSTSRPTAASVPPKAPTKRPSVAPAAFHGRPVRDPEKLVERILTVLVGQKDGMNTHVLRDAVNAAQSDFAKAVASAIAQGKILKSGQKRGTIYYIAEASVPSSPAPPAITHNSTVAA